MYPTAQDRWRGFLAWLGSGVSGIPPFTLRRTLGPIAALLPLARHMARAIDPWLSSLLAERQRLGLALMPRWLDDVADIVERDTTQQPYRHGETPRSPRWLDWLLVAELLRLVRLAEAPEVTLRRRDWLAWEVRYWALAVCLARLGQLYSVQASDEGHAAAARALEAALAVAWVQATAAARAA